MRKLIMSCVLFAGLTLIASGQGPFRPLRPIRPGPDRPNPQPAGGPSTVAGRTYQGEELTIDLPPSQQRKNIESEIDEAGMCVFTSAEMAAIWCGLEQMRGFTDWCASHYRGGGTPKILAQRISQYCKAKGIPEPPYVQYEGDAPEAVLSLLDKTARCACITYGYSPRYRGPKNPSGRVAHMICCMHYGTNAAVLDNNFIATAANENVYEWMQPAELVRRMKLGGGAWAWVFAWLAPAPAPPPSL